ncbi:protein involved in biosynthesis of mitomycin antibiotics/polyketide fumonisin [Chthonomonas calidirosea]|uniref:phytanoyl-CoA dioxygenase family protein n=1 Tax=Chthonomonas calidirosea TaxID=454171 RepID=UPI0006DD5497|nr:phytanoyl-CoA dioxygenase family protein [Chthonomonas calidirosea]CEK17138.1 protein involved in biosynthesis of mitomycin antibiotics/polyketide fumonisin [Chthonomonas calidirosea]
MLTLTPTPDEMQTGQLSPEHLQAAREAILTEGFVVLKNVVDKGHLKILQEKMLEDLHDLQARKDAPYNWNRGNIQQDPPPFPPYLFQDILLNDLVIAVTKAVLGPKPRNVFYSGNTALPSPYRQPVHLDMPQLYKEDGSVSAPYALVINVPVVTMDPENGSTEIWPGTHACAEVDNDWPNLEVPEPMLARQRKIAPPLQPTVEAGSVLIRDIRLWHAGMPNRTPTPRPMIAMIHAASWYRHIGSNLRFPKDTEAFFAHPELITEAVFVEEPIDYLHQPHGFAYQAEAE